LKCGATDHSHFLDLNNLEEALKVHVSIQLNDLMKIMNENKASKKDFTNVLYALDIVKVANAHFLFVMYWVFKKNMQNGSIKCPNLRQNMTNLCLLYGLTHLQKDLTWLYKSGYFKSNIDYPALIMQAIKELLTRIRPQALSIIESCNLTDEMICSAIGNQYGDIYETHLECAKNSRLNKNKDNIADGFKEIVLPIIQHKM